MLLFFCLFFVVVTVVVVVVLSVLLTFPGVFVSIFILSTTSSFHQSAFTRNSSRKILHEIQHIYKDHCDLLERLDTVLP